MGETHSFNAVTHNKKVAGISADHLATTKKGGNPTPRTPDSRPTSRELPGQTEFLREDVELRVACGEKCAAVHDGQRFVAKLVVVALDKELPVRSNLVCKPGDCVPPG